MADALSFLASLDTISIVLLFWYTTLLEMPRYFIGALVIALAKPPARPRTAADGGFGLSVILVGHNEAAGLRRCVRALAEQTIARTSDLHVVVVDDGSTDRMADVARELQSEGLVNEVMRLGHRGGKSAAINLAFGACSGDIVIIADIDTTFDRDAFAALVACFDDPRVGAVSGDLGVRNAGTSLITRHQAIEYMLSIGLGRQIADWLGTLTTVSGAFGAYRRAAVEAVGRQDAEVGEDADLTMKLRRAGWRIRFAPEARALTEVPETVSALVTQRLRWDRGLITIWSRKFRGELDPRQSTFRLSNVLTALDVLVFEVLLTLAFLPYLVWLWVELGDLAAPVLAATLIGYAVLDLLAVATAAAVGLDRPARYIVYAPLYTVTQVTLMRIVRLVAIVEELIFRVSYRDPYVPSRVMSQVERV